MNVANLPSPEISSRGNEPVFRGKNDPKKPQFGVGLTLSGGGYRAMLFHLGSLWRLNELGILPKLEQISSVSGGSITAGVLGMNWEALGLNDKPSASKEDFIRLVANPLRAMASRNIDVSSALLGVLGPGTAGDWVARAYNKRLFRGATLKDLPNRPLFVINATNVQSGALWRFTKFYMWDYKVGKVENPDISLAVAVAASSAFPPFLSPMVLHLDPSKFKPRSGQQKFDKTGNVLDDTFRGKIILTDGGIYDNLGLETVWKNYTTVLVSDAGGRIEASAIRKLNWFHHLADVLSWTDNQVRSLRKRQLWDSLNLSSRHSGGRDGAYWGIYPKSTGYNATLKCPPAHTVALAKTPTRLKRLCGVHQERLINWGYASCDAEVTKRCPQLLPPSIPLAVFPYPNSGTG